jgi:hypothetical protein
VWGLADTDLREWVRSRLTDCSLNCFTSPVAALKMRRAEFPRTYLSANAENYPAKAAFGPIAEMATADGCQLHRFDTGHDIMLEAPEDFADVLLASAA